MKKPTFSRIAFIALLLFMGLESIAQNYVPFVPRYDEAIKGDMLLIGNNNLSVHRSNNYNGSTNNESSSHRDNMVYVDIDNDNSTFNSSSANLNVPSDTNCYQVVYAALYWTAVVKGDTPMSDIKFKTPESGSYIDITGEQIYYQNSSSNRNSNAYVYYKNVTDIISGLSDADGTYSVANISSTTSATMTSGRNTEGLSAGWSLFVIYEDPLLPSKYITSFDGFTKINNTGPVADREQSFDIVGFRTIPVGPVRAKYAFSALEGDKSWTGDYLEINGTRISATTAGGTTIRPSNNFFNSSVSIVDPNTNSPMPFTDRNPASSNTLGFDAGIINIPNAGNSVIGNGDTSATIKLGTRTDIYYFYFNAFAIEIIAPKIVLTKIVEDTAGNDIGGQLVNLGDELNYVIGFQNVGNDDATNLIIRDVLPQNIVFNYPEDMGLLPAGVSVQSYNSATREIIFEVDNSVVEINDPVQEIRFKVTVVKTCSLLNDACSNIISNQAYSTYNGTDNPNFTISDDPSFSSNTGCLLTPGATNFLADITCDFEEEVILCGTSVTLTAGSGYDAYRWSTSPTGSPVIGTTQSITVTATGTYYVHNTATAPCQSIDQRFVVVTYGENAVNPLLPFADEIVTCPNDGKQLPNFFLCGANDIRNIETNITDTSSIIWEKLDETSCAAVPIEDCANEDGSCQWNQVASGPNYNIDLAGQYRITLNYEGGCFSQYYFNVYSNVLIPTATSKDIICDTPGEIAVGGVPNGYEYSIDGVNYQTNSTFSIATPGVYSVYVKQIGVDSSPCIFSVPDIQIRARSFTGTAEVSQPLCHDDKGSVKLAANDARAQYFYSLSKGATLVHEVGPVMESDYSFNNLNAGSYTATISTEDGCTEIVNFEIINPALLTATSAITRPFLACDYPDNDNNDDKEGEGDSDGSSEEQVRGGIITVYPNGGTAPYYYFVNGATEFQSEPEIIVTAPDTYTIRVVDANNCSTETTIVIEETPAPDFTVESTDILCADPNSGTINVNVTNAHGTTLKYSIDGGVTFVNSGTFSGLTAGSYEVVVEYMIGTASCWTEPETVIINPTVAMEGVATLTAPFTCDTNGTITVSGVSGGTAPHQYSIDGVNFQASPTFSNLTAGNYTVTVKDALECTFATNSITIDALNPPTNLTFNNTLLTCPSNTSEVTITGTTGGTGALEYQIIAPAAAVTAYQSSATFAGLAPGTYTFQVKDANDCTYSESYTIAPLPIIQVVAQPISDETCFGADDGSARFTVSGTTNFTYTINGGSATSGTSPVVLTGLTVATHTIVVTDTTTNCTATASVTINGSTAALTMATTIEPITCLQDGSVKIDASGGWGGNTYSLTLPNGTVLPAQANNTFSNLTQDGTYTVSVTDSKNCIVTETFVLVTPDDIVATIEKGANLCYNASTGATIEVNVTTGEAPFEYSINGNAFQNSNTFINLVPGSYTIIVRDAYGCELTLPAEVIEPQLSMSTVFTKDLDCTASPDAVITGTIIGGYAPFTHEVSINGGSYTTLGATGSPFVYTTANSGTYQFRVTDAQGCTIESGITTIDPLSLPAISAAVQTQDILCFGDDNGSIKVTIDTSVGTAPFVININNDTTGTNYGTQTSGLAAGTYTVTVTDAKSCTVTETVVIDQPDAIVVDYHSEDITCDPVGGISKGSVIIDGVTGGTPPYNYFVTGTNGYDESELNTDGSTSYTFDVVDFGLYQINVVDDNGCSILVQNVLVASPPDDLDIVIQTTVDCANGGEAIVSVGTALASAGPFYFSTYPATGTAPGGSWIAEDTVGSKSTTFTNLTPGVTYTFIVYDESTGCSHYEIASEPIPTNSNLTASAVTENNITCTGSDDGNVTFTINSPYSIATTVNYEIFNSLSLVSTGVSGSGSVPANGILEVSDLGPLPFGNYYVLISETSGPNTGCSVVTVPFNITESAIPLRLTTSVDQNANCNANSGLISAVGRDGTAPYTYQLTTTPGAPLATDPAWASANTFNRDAGDYYVHVMDAYGCIVSSPVVVLPQDPTPVVALNLTNQCDTDEGSFEIEVTLPTAGIAPYSFSINGGAFQTRTAPFTISNLNSGTHTVEVRDANGCGNIDTITIEPPIGITPAITALPSCENDDGVITVDAIGGSGSYSYAISPNAGSIVLTGGVFSGVPSGTYTITVTDTNTLCTADVSVSLEAATPVTFTTEKTDVSCHGGSDGTITVNLPATNDNPVYTYAIIAGPSLVSAQGSKVFTGLVAGNYTVEVTSGRGCSSPVDVTITEPTELTVSGVATDFACALDNSKSVSTLTITAVGGTTDYVYSIDGTNYFTTNTFDIIDTGVVQTINIFVKDANGCEATDTVTINPLPELSAAAVAIVDAIDCNGTGSVRIDVTGGSGDFLYQMLPIGTPQASNSFNITLPGDYYFQVTDVVTGCYIETLVFTVDLFDLIDVVATPTTAVTCFGSTNGALEINVSNYTGNYTYEVLDSAGISVIAPTNANTSTNPQVINGLTGGNYTIVVTETDSPFCATVTNVVTIASPATPLLLEVSETSNVTCDDNQGTITALASGGWGSYEYELTGAATVAYSSNGTFTGLSAGVYTVNVRDAGGCIETETVTLVVPTPIAADFTASATTLPCFGDQTASITVSNVTGGQGSNYTYTLNTVLPTPSSSGPQTSPVFSGLGAGTYTVTITDAYNCSFSSTDIVIEQPTRIEANLVAVTNLTCTTQARVTLSASGGTGLYTYSNSETFASILGTFTTSTTFDVSAGTYKYYVRDANGCVATVTNEIKIDPVPPLLVNLSATDISINCYGDNNGTITATAQGGLGNYIYTLQDASRNPIPSAIQMTKGVFTNLPAGIYYVHVESGDCDSTSQRIEIKEPLAPLQAAAVVSNVSCYGGNDGSVEITATGGTGLIKYAISPQLNQFFEKNVFEDLAPGTYDIIVQDAAGCFEVLNVTITEPDAVVVSLIPGSIIPEICEGDTDGMFSITISGGTAPYSVSLDDYDGPYTTGTGTQTQFDFTGLKGGDHSVFVRDSEGCESEWNITFPESVKIDPIAVIEYLCEDNLPANRVTVTFDDSIQDMSDLDFALNGGTYQSSNVFSNIVSGTGHYIDVRHTNGCVQRTPLFDIGHIDQLALVLTDGGMNEIVATATGGTEGYEFTFNGEDYGSTNTFIITESGNYTVTVTDSSGCIASDTRYFEYIPICIPNYFTPNGDHPTWAPGCDENYPNIEFKIFDRYGREVGSYRQGGSWDGKYRNRELPTGDYWYIIKLNDEKDDRDFVGHFTLYR
ncbi:T9SS type B sorting domain-containing protein [Gelidibacter pelagius]|uniref:T9SS type B sorting domain-containing protein n=1 Tax=Gelidibacter pelagius TaxID=2819985 RepID=A0ABS3SQ03_9FLAO|nr:T9SS type B sorting domain-containing protein [Gelidibacter pelagius]MBO3097790.1 T9SS type B sorting domain-containing protein [Gelidibacter pelagius]